MYRYLHNKSKSSKKACNVFNFYEDEFEYPGIIGSNAANEIMKLRCMHYIKKRRS